MKIYFSQLSNSAPSFGDKTQLLAFILAARFKKPLPIIAGILLATIINHGMAGALSAWITATISPDILRWILHWHGNLDPDSWPAYPAACIE